VRRNERFRGDRIECERCGEYYPGVGGDGGCICEQFATLT